MELSDSVAVVTGASAGIGRAAAWHLASRGASVVLAARREDRLKELATAIADRGGRAHPVATDVTHVEDLERLRDEAVRAFGRVDVLVNNAGIPGGGPFASAEPAQIERCIEVNVLGVMRATKVFLPGFLERERGHVVNVASLAGRFAAPGISVYAASKHAVVAFSESLNATTSHQGVLVTAVNPAFVPTEGFRAPNRPSFLILTPERVAGVVVKVIREGIAPEYNIPRWAAAGQLLRLLTPRLYSWAMAAGERRFGDSTPRT